MVTAIETARKLATSGGHLYRVGGSVRDEYARRESHDLDFAVTGVTAEYFENCFPGARQVGKQFPVYLLDLDGVSCEVALARNEKKAGAGHKGFDVAFSPSITIEQDLARRDITINAMAVEVLTGQWIDPFGGREDFDHGIIRATTEAFREDPLRVYRAARFAAVFQFAIEETTMTMMSDMVAELPQLSVERVWEETKKALGAVKPSVYFRYLRAVGALAVHFSEIDQLYGVEQPLKYHPEGDAFEHTMQVLDAARRLTDRHEVLWSALVHDVGKGTTPRSKWPHHYAHEIRGVVPARTLCERLKVPSQWEGAGLFATEHHMKLHHLDKMRALKVVNLLHDAQRSALGVDGFIIVGLADERGRGNPDLENLYLERVPSKWKTLCETVNGRTVTISAKGEKFGERLNSLRAAWWSEHVNKSRT